MSVKRKTGEGIPGVDMDDWLKERGSGPGKMIVNRVLSAGTTKELVQACADCKRAIEIMQSVLGDEKSIADVCAKTGEEPHVVRSNLSRKITELTARIESYKAIIDSVRSDIIVVNLNGTTYTIA